MLENNLIFILIKKSMKNLRLCRPFYCSKPSSCLACQFYKQLTDLFGVFLSNECQCCLYNFQLLCPQAFAFISKMLQVGLRYVVSSAAHGFTKNCRHWVGWATKCQPSAHHLFIISHTGGTL